MLPLNFGVSHLKNHKEGWFSFILLSCFAFLFEEIGHSMKMVYKLLLALRLYYCLHWLCL